MDSSGVITGIPTAATGPGGAVITVQVAESLGGEDHRDFTMTVE